MRGHENIKTDTKSSTIMAVWIFSSTALLPQTAQNWIRFIDSCMYPIIWYWRDWRFLQALLSKINAIFYEFKAIFWSSLSSVNFFLFDTIMSRKSHLYCNFISSFTKYNFTFIFIHDSLCFLPLFALLFLWFMTSSIECLAFNMNFSYAFRCCHADCDGVLLPCFWGPKRWRKRP